MSLSCGIVGLPNVGKSTLFNALTNAKAESSNYPFCTIEPNKGIVPVYDERLKTLSDMSNSKETVYATVEFIDIAGLVKGASKGEGLGNQFLSNIRSTDAIIQVVRVFENENIVHIGEVDPVRDLDIINTELILSDLEMAENIYEKQIRTARSGNKEAKAIVSLMEKIKDALAKETFIRKLDFSENELLLLKGFQFLTTKPFLIVANVSEDEILTYPDNKHFKALEEKAKSMDALVVPLCAKIEQELSELDLEDKNLYLEDLGLKESGLNVLAKKAYELLGLITYFTTGEKESKAWTVKKGSTAPEAARVIHSDIERGFIRAEIVSYETLKELKSWHKAKEEGLLRQEGKDYIMKDGDTVYFLFNV